MAGIGNVLLGMASGAAGAINKDAEANREFIRKRQSKVADSQLIRQEKAYDKRRADYDNVKKNGTGPNAQYVYAMGIFNDPKKAAAAAHAGVFANAVANIKDPGEFVPYDVGISDQEARNRYGRDTLGGKLLSKFGINEERRREFRKDESAGRDAELEQLSQQARVAMGDETPTQLTDATSDVLPSSVPITGEVPVQGTTGAPTGAPTDTHAAEAALFAPERDLQPPQLQYVPSLGKSIMLQFDSESQEFVSGDSVYKMADVEKAPVKDKKNYEELSALRTKLNEGTITPEEKRRHNFLLNSVAPWRHVTLDLPSGGKTTEVFRVDPLTNERVTIDTAGKKSAATLDTMSERTAEATGTFLAHNVSLNTGYSENTIAALENMDDEARAGLELVLGARAEQYKQNPGVTTDQKAYELALKELETAIPVPPAVSWWASPEYIFDMQAGLDILETPAVVSDKPADLMAKPSVKTKTLMSTPNASDEQPTVALTRDQKIAKARAFAQARQQQ